MIGNYRVHGAVFYSLYYRQAVALFSQRRIDFSVRVAAQTELVRSRKIVRAGFAGNFYAACLCLSYQLRAAFGTYMRDVYARAESFCKNDISRYHDLFARAGNSLITRKRRVIAFVHYAVVDERHILAVAYHEHTETACVFKRDTHELRALHGSAVIRERYRARFFELAHFGDRFAIFAYAYCGYRIDFCKIDLSCSVFYISHDVFVVSHGFCVGHTA